MQQLRVDQDGLVLWVRKLRENAEGGVDYGVMAGVGEILRSISALKKKKKKKAFNEILDLTRLEGMWLLLAG